MTTATTSTVVSNANTAGFDAWVTEIIVQLLGVGLSQTTDTGQMANPCVTALPGAANTSAGYYVFEFNDTLNAGYPVFIKLEMGTGSAVAQPQMWITVGTGSNGSGTITGTVMTRVALCPSATLVSTSTNYTSYFVYNATYGVLGMAWKQGAAVINTKVCYSGFYVFRGSTSAGAANSDAVNLISSSSTATGIANASSALSAYMQCLSYANSTVYPASAATQGQFWCMGPLFFQTVTVSPATPIVRTASYMNPEVCSSAVLGVVASADVNVGTSFTTTLFGSAAITMMNVGAMFGSEVMILSANSSGYSTTTGMGLTASTGFGVAILWQ